jgi:hypothetical protein
MSSGLLVLCLNQMLTTFHHKDTEEDCIITIGSKPMTILVQVSSENSMLAVGQALLSGEMLAISKEPSLTRITAITIQTSSDLQFSV